LPYWRERTWGKGWAPNLLFPCLICSFIGWREQGQRVGTTNLLFPCLICSFSGGRGQGQRVGTELTFSMSHLFLLLPGIQGLADRGHQQQQQQRHQQVLQLLQHHGKERIEDMARFETNITAVLHQTSLYSVFCSMGFFTLLFSGIRRRL
jgi:hypothetical protein